ncbi:DUF5641 domain-containing protein [Trichonephila clavipes]|nr:DUF5641 domain-containing protein [Trichonephila clavipes]
MLDRDTINHIATKQGRNIFQASTAWEECDVYLSARGKVSNDLMSRNTGSGVKTDGRNRGQTVSIWRQIEGILVGMFSWPKPKRTVFYQLAKDEKSRFPLASETLLYDTYMYDIVSGAPDLETVHQLQSQLKDDLQSCANRVAKVQELTEGFQWNHVTSVLNPTDLVSRGLRPCDLPNLRLWWHGPQSLEKSQEVNVLNCIPIMGKTFVGAIKELKRFLKLIKDSDDNLAVSYLLRGIEWKFIPPRVSSFGGL